MSIYTSFDMIADCKAGKPEGAVHLVKHLLPPLRWLHRHYGLSEPDLALVLKQTAAIEPMNERRFVAHFRPEPPLNQSTLDLETIVEAFGELTLVERQIVWLDTMAYETPDAARHLRISAETAQKARDKAGALLRSKLDDWSITILRENGAHLGRQARAAAPAETVPFHDYIEIIDGRMTWQSRTPIERALADSWHEIDHLCRVREADAAKSETKPLTDDQSRPILAGLGVTPPKPPFLKRLFGK